jgi:hypothetical protein
MRGPDVVTLTAEVAELHGDARNSARAEQLCEVVAGPRLIEIRASMEGGAFSALLAVRQIPWVVICSAALTTPVHPSLATRRACRTGRARS